MLFKTALCFMPSSERRARSKQANVGLRFKRPALKAKRFKLWRNVRKSSAPRKLYLGGRRSWSYRVRGIFSRIKRRKVFRRTAVRKRYLLNRFVLAANYAALVAGRRRTVFFSFRRQRALGPLFRYQLRAGMHGRGVVGAVDSAIFTAQTDTKMGRAALIRDLVIYRSCFRLRPRRRTRFVRPATRPLSSGLRRLMWQLYVRSPVSLRLKVFRHIRASWERSAVIWQLPSLRHLIRRSSRYNLRSLFSGAELRFLSRRRLFHRLQRLRTSKPLHIHRFLRSVGAARHYSRRKRRHLRRSGRFVKRSSRVRFGRRTAFRLYIYCAQICEEDPTFFQQWFLLRRYSRLGRRLRILRTLRAQRIKRIRKRIYRRQRRPDALLCWEHLRPRFPASARRLANRPRSRGPHGEINQRLAPSYRLAHVIGRGE
jgi:hypothetical protein